MALIGKIRQNSWLLVVMIALGLGGFIFMDMFSGQQSIFGSGATEMVNVNGKSVDIQEFNRVESILYGNSSGDPFSRRQYLFNSFIDEKIVGEEAEAIGLGVGEDELEELTFGNNLSPIITSRFSDPQTRQVNREALNSYKDDVRPEQADAFWNYQKEEIKTDRLKTKIIQMAEKAIYTPTWLADMAAADRGGSRKAALVNIPYEAIDNSEVTLSDADYSAYLTKNMAKYTSDEEQRRMEYVVFRVEATAADKADLRNKAASMKSEFSKETDNENYVSRNYGSMTQQWFTQDALPKIIADSVALLGAGDVYGPYEEGNAYKLAKVVEKQVMQDSAKVRHILISASTPAEFTAAEKTVDSLMNVIRTTNTSWDTLALRHSQDPGSKNKGGFYDYAAVNTYVPAFNDAAFFNTPVGSLTSVRTQFGVHLIEPMGRKGDSKAYYRIAYISENIIPSEETQRDVENLAIDFVDENRSVEQMKKAAAEKGLSVEVSQPVKENDYFFGTLGSNQTSRDIVRWAFGKSMTTDVPSVGDVSPELYSYNNEQGFYTDKYVAVALKSIQAPGNPTVADVKDQIEPFVMNMKKAAMLSERVAGKTDLAAIASSFEEVSVDTIGSVTFGNPTIAKIGSEPAVQGAVFNTAVNQVSKPVEGNRGVYIVKPLSEANNPNTQSIAQKRQAEATSMRSQVRSALINSLRKKASISDNRARFF